MRTNSSGTVYWSGILHRAHHTSACNQQVHNSSLNWWTFLGKLEYRLSCTGSSTLFTHRIILAFPYSSTSQNFKLWRADISMSYILNTLSSILGNSVRGIIFGGNFFKILVIKHVYTCIKLSSQKNWENISLYLESSMVLSITQKKIKNENNIRTDAYWELILLRNTILPILMIMNFMD
jgi:hypothetical protein